MKNLHAIIEAWFSALTAFVYKRKYRTLISVILITACFISQIPKITIDMRDESFFHDDDPILIEYNQFRDTFGQDDIFIVGLKPENGLTIPFLHTLVKLHHELESSLPYLHDISSLVNGRIVRGEEDTLFVEELMQSAPQNATEHEALLSLIDHYPLYRGYFISEDKSLASIIIKAEALVNPGSEDSILEFDGDTIETRDTGHKYLSNEQNIEIYEVIRKVTAKYENLGIDFHFAGTPVFVAEITKGIEKDLSMMMPLSFIMIILFLALLFRRISGVVFSLLIVMLSLLSSIGIMAMMGIPFTTVIQILPTFLIVVGISDSVHILAIFYKHFREHSDKQSAIVEAVGYAGLPVLMTSLTTALGLLSFAFADVKSIAQLGYVASIGVMMAFLYTVILLPALISIFPIKSKKLIADGKQPLSDRIFSLIARTTTRRPGLIIAVSTVIVVTAFYCALFLRFSHNAMTWFPEDSPIRIASDLIDKTNGGSVMLEVTVDSGSENGLYDPDLVQRLDQASVDILGISVHDIRAGQVRSIADILKETNRALNEDDSQAYVVPGNRELIAQELLLFESSGSDDLEDVSDSMYQIGRLSILAPFTDSIHYKDYVDKLSEYLERQFASETVNMTGHISLFIQITKHFITSMAKSYVFALIVITLLMLIMIARIRVGLLSMIANVVPIVLIFGIMGILKIPLDMSTILVGSIVLGLVVDDTIHFLHHFRKAYDHTNDVEEAVRITFFTTGRALVITSMVLCAGFFIYMASFLVANIRFGLLVGCAVIFALAADFFLIPALLSIVHKKRKMA
ncbi:MAG: MMPL family transporter [Thermodesulfobacteriota bacterium]